ncbi:MAG: FkbM family methyltransferase [Acidimicrobiia bacterium]|nr:FkbM family methyltransferase [Acidimicrobiia bacterium]MBV9041278.1 FkbM family methyltransferase [Acidimicrobiia bacterium]
MPIADALRERNALEKLRRFGPLRWALRTADFPMWRRVRGAAQPVRLRWLQHMSYYLPSHGAEPELAALMIALVRELPVRSFVDVGANFGYYSWLLDEQARDALEIHLFEPDAANQRLVRATLGRRPAGNATLHPVALGAEEGTALFYRDLDSGHRGSLVGEAAVGPAVTTDVRRLDGEVPAPPPLTLVKIDVEGGEEDVLAGASSLLSAAPVVVVECYHHDDTAAWRQLAAHPGYQLFDAATVAPPTADTANYLAIPPSVSAEELGRVRAERDRILRLPRLDPVPSA